MSVNICIDDNLLDVVIDALTKKMGSINTMSIISKIKTERMEQQYSDCDKALDLFNRAKESLENQKAMAK